MLKAFFVRLGSSIVILAIYVCMYAFRMTYALNVIVAITAAGAVYEFCKVTDEAEGRALMPCAVVYAFATPILNEPLITTAVFIVCVFCVLVFRFERVSVQKLFFCAFTAAVITLSMTCITLLQNYKSIDYVMPLCYGSAVTDVFCYVTGILFGKHKLSPTVSPHKSVEGAVGGTIFTAAVFALYAVFANGFFNINVNIAAAAVVGVVFAVFAQMGDLAESAIKRKYDVKDFGNFIPGHGGFYDRIDSWITTAPLVLVIATLI